MSLASLSPTCQSPLLVPHSINSSLPVLRYVAAQLLATGVSRSVPKPCSAYPNGNVQRREDNVPWFFADLTGCSVPSRIFSSSLPRETVGLPFGGDIRNVWSYTSTYTVCGWNFCEIIWNLTAVCGIETRLINRGSVYLLWQDIT
jgi:hypothetical protein